MRRDHREWVTVDDEEYFETLFKLVEVGIIGSILQDYFRSLLNNSLTEAL